MTKDSGASCPLPTGDSYTVGQLISAFYRLNDAIGQIPLAVWPGYVYVCGNILVYSFVSLFETNIMRKNTLRVSVVTVLAAGLFVAFSSGPTSSRSTTCPESTRPCCQEKKTQDALRNTNPESISGQFFSFAGMN
jgi:hypothetical protein